VVSCFCYFQYISDSTLFFVDGVLCSVLYKRISVHFLARRVVLVIEGMCAGEVDAQFVSVIVIIVILLLLIIITATTTV